MYSGFLFFNVIVDSAPVKKFHVDYDRKADVLYISFDRPQKATDTEVTEEGILLRYRDNELVGITVLNASRFKGKI